MSQNRDEPKILAIDSAIAGGSLAISNGSDILGELSGDAAVSRSEILLPNILDLVSTTIGSLHELDRILVSIGPGSYTGLRIGIATAMGLSRSLKIPYIGVNTLDALAGSEGPDGGRIAIVPVGKSDICFGIYDKGSNALSSGPFTGSIEDMYASISGKEIETILAHNALVERIRGLAPCNLEGIDVVDRGTNMAIRIAQHGHTLPPSGALVPLYVENSRFQQNVPS